MKNIVLVEDHLLVREGLVRLVSLQNDYAVIGSFDDAEALLANADLSKIDLLITDIQLNGMDGLSLAEVLKKTHPAIKIIVLSTHESAFYVSRAQSIGVEAYITKRDVCTYLLEATKRVLQGGRYYESVLSTQYAEEAVRFQVYLDLSDREKQIFILLAQGHDLEQVSGLLHIAVKIAYEDKQNIFHKMKISTDFETTRIAVKLGLINLPQV